MIRFVICDDDQEKVDEVKLIIRKLMMPNDKLYDINSYNGYDKEILEIANNSDEKIYILDIEMHNKNGIDIASMIRKYDWNGIIIFLTSFSNYKESILSKKLLAYSYICKGEDYKKKLYTDINGALNILGKNIVLCFTEKNVTYRILRNDIIYIKSKSQKKCVIVTDKGCKFEVTACLADILKLLGPSFVLTHKSYIINIDKIANIDYSSRIIKFINGMSGLMLSTRKGKEVKEYVNNHY